MSHLTHRPTEWAELNSCGLNWWEFYPFILLVLQKGFQQFQFTELQNTNHNKQ
ncbi:hypothetical protein SRHO_G00250830, partial [Serrasalmus rhombeus]